MSLKNLKFEFDPETHIYRLNGSILPGYSEIAKAMGIVDYSSVPRFVMEVARNFGDAAHYATKLWDLKDLDENTLDEQLKPALEIYKRFLVDYDVKIMPEYIEQPIYSYIYRYGITPDRICLIKGELSILELKFVAKLMPAVALQTAAQKRAAEEYYCIKIKRRYALQINSKNEYLPPVEFKNKGDDSAWLCFLGAYNWLRRNNDGRNLKT